MKGKRWLALLVSLCMVLALLPAGAVTARADGSIPISCYAERGGTVKTEQTSASLGDTVTVTVIPESGYKLGDIYLLNCVTDNYDGTMNYSSFTTSNIQVEQSTTNSNQYTFTIPENYSISTQSGYFSLRVVATFVSEAGTESGGNGSSNAENSGDNGSSNAENGTGAVDPGTGSGTGQNQTFYQVTIQTDHATVHTTVSSTASQYTVSNDKALAYEGATVTLEVEPDMGYRLDTLTVMQGDTVIPLNDDNQFTMPAGDVTVTATVQALETVSVSSWTQLRNCVNYGYNITLAQNITAEEGDGILEVPGGTTAVLNLNGHTVDATVYSSEDNKLDVYGKLFLTGNGTLKGVNVWVNSQGDFRMTGGTITDNTDFGVLVDGTFEMSGGTITGNTADQGGGVYVSSGTFEMSGGSITGNTADKGGGVIINEGRFQMSGGSITGNTANKGGGVDVNSGTFHMSGGSITGNTSVTDGGGVRVRRNNASVFSVSGKPKIYNNKITNNIPSNVLLEKGKTITVAGKLKEGANIGVSAYDDMDGRVLTSGFSDKGSLSNFFSDDDPYLLEEENGEVVLRKKVPKFHSRSLVLAGQLGMYYYVTPPDNYDGTETTVTFALDGQTFTKNWSEGEVQTDGRVRFTCPVNSIQMADNIIAAINDPKAPPVENTYTVEQYLDYLVANADTVPEYAKALKLVKAIHDYGYYAQLALDSGKKHTAMHEPYTAAEDLTTSLENYQVTATLKDGVTDPTYSLSLDSETAINFYFTTEETVTEKDVSVTSGDKAAAFRLEQAGTNRYRLVIPNISAHLLGDTYTATVATSAGDSVFTGSALSYAQTVLGNDTADASLKHLTAALYNYYRETMAYRNGNA